MSFFRNREVRIYTLILLILAVIFIVSGFLISREAGILIIIYVFSLCSCFYLFTYHRYKQISSLSEYLRRISSGEYSLDIRDNHEGELSILKSEIYKVTLMLSEYNEQLKREKVILSDHMANISHQLKTPLTSMMVMADLLADENLSEQKRKEFISHIQAQLERIEWLVSSLLKMSKLDAGVVEMNKKDVSVKTLIDKAVDPLLISMELKDIQYIDNYSSHLLNLCCDLNWTAEALTNILKNCVEHTPESGKITVLAQDNPLYTEIKIADNGVGIRKEDLPYVFTRFYKGKNSSPDSVGIGLAMSKSIVNNQGGDITVRSEPGKGTQFTIRLYKTVI